MSELVTVDSRGRVIVPLTIRQTVGIADGMRLMLVADLETREIRLLPLADTEARLLDVKMTFEDAPGVLARVASVMAEWGIDLLSTESRTLRRGHSAEWHAIVDMSKSGLKAQELRRRLLETGAVKNVEVREST